MLQTAIVIFLIGSALCGIAQGMTELIAFRALQGLGAGGLMVTTIAVVGDIIPPRDRGKYQGLFGAVFGVSTVIGPLLGGFFVDNLSWRWIFYVNLPLGALALFVIGVVFHSRAEHVRHAIDYLGAATLAGGLACIVLFTSLGGTTEPWGSVQSIALIVVGVALLVVFLLVERRAQEPILPLELFRNRTFAVTSAIGFIIGLALFGSITYLPLFLQVVKGMSPTKSGLQLTPMMAGLLVTSIVAGRTISRFGRYRPFPIVGTAVMTVGMVLLARLSVHSSTTTAALDMLVLGLGLGMVMQVLVLAVQNAVEFRVMGVATSGSILFRQIGGSIGLAIFGAIFANSLHSKLAAYLPPGAHVPKTVSPAVVRRSRRGCTTRTPMRSRRRCTRCSSPPPSSPSSRSCSRGCSERCRCGRPLARRRGGARGRCVGGDRALTVSSGPHGYELFHVDDRADWRPWLERNHATAQGVWVVTWRSHTGKARLDYDALVEEALCFGWVDSREQPVDDERLMQLVTPRKAGGAWARSNKSASLGSSAGD